MCSSLAPCTPVIRILCQALEPTAFFMHPVLTAFAEDGVTKYTISSLCTCSSKCTLWAFLGHMFKKIHIFTGLFIRLFVCKSCNVSSTVCGYRHLFSALTIKFCFLSCRTILRIVHLIQGKIVTRNCCRFEKL